MNHRCRKSPSFLSQFSPPSSPNFLSGQQENKLNFVHRKKKSLSECSIIHSYKVILFRKKNIVLYWKSKELLSKSHLKTSLKKLVKSAKFTDEYFSEVVFWKHLANCFLVFFYFFFFLLFCFSSPSLSARLHICKSTAILQTRLEQSRGRLRSFELAQTVIAWAPVQRSVLPQPQAEAEPAQCTHTAETTCLSFGSLGVCTPKNTNSSFEI